MCTDAVVASPGVRDAVARLGLELRREEARLNDIERAVVVHRAAVR